MRVDYTHKVKFTIANLPEVEHYLDAYQLSLVDLCGTLHGLHYMGETEKPVYVFMTDTSSAKDGVVEAPEFHFGLWDDGTDGNQVYGPITWNVVDELELAEKE